MDASGSAGDPQYDSGQLRARIVPGRQDIALRASNSPLGDEAMPHAMAAWTSGRRVTVKCLSDRLLPWLGGALSVLLVASLSAAIALPRHLDDIAPSVVDGTLGLAAPAPAPERAPPAVAPTAEEAPAPVVVVTDPAADEPPASVVVDAAPEPAAPPDEQPVVDPAPASDPPADAGAVDPAQELPTDPPAEPPSSTTDAPTDDSATAQSEPAPQVSESERIFAEEFPHHAAARQTDDPATHGWAVLVGVNRYHGRTRDTFGSVADVMVLREVLLAHGWRDDHILVLIDHDATHDRIVRGIEWLMRTTDERSTAVFSFSGHMRNRDGMSALWPTDNRFIWGPDLSRMLGAVPAGRLWASLQGCHAEGLRAPGLEGPGRVITYSSRAVEKSYEDPEVGHSVQGYFLFSESLRAGSGDADGDGLVSVQEAYGWTAPRARIRTAHRQNPVLADGVGEAFHLHLG